MTFLNKEKKEGGKMLYFLKRIDEKCNWYDTESMVVRAKDFEEARRLAADNAQYSTNNKSESRQFWLKEEFSTCEEIDGDGKSEVICMDTPGI